MKNHPPKAGHAAGPQKSPEAGDELRLAFNPGNPVKDLGKGSLAQMGQRAAQGVTPLGHTPEPQGLKRRHFMGTALALDAAALLAACGGGGGDSGGTNMGGSGSGSSSGSSSASGSGSSSSSASSSGSASSSASSSASGSGSGSAAPTNWVVSTFAGTGSSLTVIDGTGGTATFYAPAGVAVDSSGYLYVADSNFQRIRKITPAGVVSTVAGSVIGSVNGAVATARFDTPCGIAVDGSGRLFVAENINSALRTITPAGVVSTLAGSGTYSYLDGTGTGAHFNQPRGVAIDASGNLFVADTSNQRIRKVTSAGVVSTLAGSGAPGAADGVGTSASFNNPYGVAVDATGVVYVADYSNHLIRKITPAGVVSTLAGTGTAGSANGTGTNASFNSPRGLAIDANGAVFVADYGNHLIRKITSEGVVSAFAGTGIRGSANAVGTLASFNNPADIALDGSGHLWVTDSNNHMIRKITPVF
jgi:sugar lactone lactonase YvrE